MGVIFIFTTCVNCRTPMSCNPEKVPSLVLDGVREPLCEACFHKWNQIHRTSKGLEPVPLHPDAYTPMDESLLDGPNF